MTIKVINVKDQFQNQKPKGVNMVVAAEAGKGKTLLASTFPNVLYADADDGLLSVRNRNVRSVSLNHTPEFEALLDALDHPAPIRAEHLGGPVDTIVIDTIDEVARMTIRSIKAQEKIQDMRIQDWGTLGDTLRSYVRRLRGINDLNVILNVHVTSEEDSETGRVWFKPAIQGAMGGELANYVDLVLLLIAKDTVDSKGEPTTKRYLQTHPDPRHGWLKDRSGCLPREFPINFIDDGPRLLELIHGPAPERELIPTTAREPVVTTAKPPRKVRALRVPAGTDVDKINREPEPEPETAPESFVAANGRDRGPNAPMPPEAFVRQLDPEVEAAPGDTLVIEDDLLADLTPVPDSVGTASAEAVGAVEEAAPAPAPVATGLPICTVCGDTVESADHADLAMIRFDTILCRKDFLARTKR